MHWWTVGLLPRFGCCAAVDMSVQIPLWDTAFLLVIYLEVEFLDHMAILFYIFWWITILLAIVAPLFNLLYNILIYIYTHTYIYVIARLWVFKGRTPILNSYLHTGEDSIYLVSLYPFLFLLLTHSLSLSLSYSLSLTLPYIYELCLCFLHKNILNHLFLPISADHHCLTHSKH